MVGNEGFADISWVLIQGAAVVKAFLFFDMTHVSGMENQFVRKTPRMNNLLLRHCPPKDVMRKKGALLHEKRIWAANEEHFTLIDELLEGQMLKKKQKSTAESITSTNHRQ